MASFAAACSGASDLSTLPLSSADSGAADSAAADGGAPICEDGTNGYLVCSGGLIRTMCCGSGALCSAPEPFCDLGGGHCAHDCDAPANRPASDSCEDAVAGAQCSSEGKQCGACPDRCAWCGVLRCSHGKWSSVGIAADSEISCAPDAGSPHP